MLTLLRQAKQALCILRLVNWFLLAARWVALSPKYSGGGRGTFLGWPRPSIAPTRSARASRSVCELLTKNKCHEGIVWLAISCKDLYSLLKAKFLPVARAQLPAVGANAALLLPQCSKFEHPSKKSG